MSAPAGDTPEPEQPNTADLPLPPAPSGRADWAAIVETAHECAVVGIEAEDLKVKAFAFAQAAAWFNFLAELDETWVLVEGDQA